MFMNPYLEYRLSDQRIHEALCVAKLDCLLKRGRKNSLNHGNRLSWMFFALPLLVIMAPIQLGKYLAKKV